MVEADDVTFRMIHNVGDYTLYEIKGSVENGETLTIPTRHTQITTATRVQMTSANNITDGSSVLDATVYDDANRQFTIVDAGAGGTDDVRILFYADRL